MSVDKEGNVAKGIVIKEQGTVPYNGPKSVSTPVASKAMSKKGVKRGMGAASRDKTFTYC